MAAQALAMNGAKVYIVGRTERKLKTVVNTHGRDIEGQIVALAGDVSNKDGIKYAEHARQSSSTLTEVQQASRQSHGSQRALP